jgi:hypothetical protein
MFGNFSPELLTIAGLIMSLIKVYLKSILTQLTNIIKMRLRIFQILLFVLYADLLYPQYKNDSINYSLNTRFTGGAGNYAPFLSTVNQYDRFSITPNSLTIWGALHKDLNQLKTFDYGFGTELDENISKTENRFFPNELYIEGKFYFMKLSIGTKREIFGNQDAELSSGGMLLSQNSRPMPKISLASNGYVDVPYTKGYVAVKGGISHGWFENNRETKNLLLHHKYAYIKIGGSFPLNINYGFHHVVQWGGESSVFGTMPVTWDNYYRIFFGKSGSSTANWSDKINTLGNHIISQNLGIDLKLESVIFSLYWQNLTEDPPLRFITQAPNVADGLWGLSVKLQNYKPFNAFVLEYMNTTDQTGPWHDLDGVIYGGWDNYFRNYGWTYQRMTIGNPWITSPKYNTDGSEYVENNLVRLYYFSGKGEFKSLNYKLILAYSENFGIINDNRTTPSYDNYKRQFSYQLETSTPVRFLKNTKVSFGISGDRGAMYGNNLALLFGVSYLGTFGY